MTAAASRTAERSTLVDTANRVCDMVELSAHDWDTDPLFDSLIVRYGFTPYMRDYDVIADVPAARPDGSGSYIEGQYRYRFTHCVEARVATMAKPKTWKISWADEFTDYSAWERAGCPDGFVWGVESSLAYPGAGSRAEQALSSWQPECRRQADGAARWPSCDPVTRGDRTSTEARCGFP